MTATMEAACDLVGRYYAAFNAGDINGMLACLSDDVAHHVNEGQVRHGKAAFGAFCDHMASSYAETLTDLTIMATPDGARAAAEFTVNGRYLKTDAGLPEATGQRYCLPAGGFFSVSGNRITRIVTYYNLSDWVRQVTT